MNRLLLTSMMLAASWPAWASAQGTVHDGANLFSADAVTKFNAAVGDFHRRTGLDFVVETVASVDDVKKGSAGVLADEKERILAQAAKERAEAKGVRGLYVLVCKDPPKLNYERTSKALRQQDAEAVSGAMLGALRKGAYDNALSAGVGALGRIHVSAPARGGGGNRGVEMGGLSPLWTILLVALGAWLLIGVFRALASGGGAGGGGFFPSLLGGLFGGMAGMWMYDNLFRGSGGGWSGDGSDSGSSGGGDWGDSSSVGGDWGGGGGDWGGGGGDYGAGGDF